MTRAAACGLAVLGLTLVLPASAAAPGGVSFSVAQRGESAVPGEGPGTTAGAGVVSRGGSYKAPAGARNAFGLVRGGVILHTDAKGGLGLTLQVVGGHSYVTGAEAATLELAVKVTASNDRACPVGRKGTLSLIGSKSGRDELVPEICGHLHLYANGEDGTVTIKLAPVAGEPRHLALVRAVLEKNAKKCELKIGAIKATRTKSGWRVTALVTTFGNRGTLVWTVVGKKVTAADPLAADIEAGCP